jgi:RimJ/RimL family protein N-acetyltransferase
MAPRSIATERLVLREPTEEDLPSYVIVTNGENSEREHIDAVAHWRSFGWGPWLVELDGQPIGALEIHYAGPGPKGIEPHEIEVGWALVEEHRGRGFATEAARAAIDDAFERAKPNYHGWIFAYIRPENAASIRVAEKLGMHHVADGITRSGDPMRIYRTTG